MIAKLANLSEAEAAQLLDAIPLITILIAGADGVIDPSETEWAEKLTKIRQYDYASEFNDYYKAVGEGYSNRVKELIEDLPGDTDRRTEEITNRLDALNALLSKLEHNYAIGLMDSFKTFAHHVARASGGFFGIGSVSTAESKLMDLPMLKAIKGEL